MGLTGRVQVRAYTRHHPCRGRSDCPGDPEAKCCREAVLDLSRCDGVRLPNGHQERARYIQLRGLRRHPRCVCLDSTLLAPSTEVATRARILRTSSNHFPFPMGCDCYTIIIVNRTHASKMRSYTSTIFFQPTSCAYKLVQVVDASGPFSMTLDI
jgi:hypothetical protein